MQWRNCCKIKSVFNEVLLILQLHLPACFFLLAESMAAFLTDSGIAHPTKDNRTNVAKNEKCKLHAELVYRHENSNFIS